MMKSTTTFHPIERYPSMNTTLSPIDCFQATHADNSNGSASKHHQTASTLYDLFKVIYEQDDKDEEHPHTLQNSSSPYHLQQQRTTDDALPSYLLLMNDNRRNSFNTFSSLETIYEEEEPQKSNQQLF